MACSKRSSRKASRLTSLQEPGFNQYFGEKLDKQDITLSLLFKKLWQIIRDRAITSRVRHVLMRSSFPVVLRSFPIHEKSWASQGSLSASNFKRNLMQLSSQ